MTITIDDDIQYYCTRSAILACAKSEIWGKRTLIITRTFIYKNEKYRTCKDLTMLQRYW